MWYRYAAKPCCPDCLAHSSENRSISCTKPCLYSRELRNTIISAYQNNEKDSRISPTDFGQVRFRELVPLEVMEQFAISKGGRFPKPQLCNGLHYLVRLGSCQSDGNTTSKESGLGPQDGAASSSSHSGSSQGNQINIHAQALPRTAGVLLIVSGLQGGLCSAFRCFTSSGKE